MKKEKIGFFGGCFNPPTNVHIQLANNLIDNKILDKVIFVPVGDYYEKKNLVPAIHRFRMLQIACNGNSKLKIEDIASIHKDKLYATDTFKLIFNKYNKIADMYLIMGSDNFQKMPTWKNYQEIISNYKFIVIERLKHEGINNLSNVIYVKSGQTEDISSTCIRNKLQRDEDVSSYLNMEVIEYIKKNNLYCNHNN